MSHWTGHPESWKRQTGLTCDAAWKVDIYFMNNWSPSVSFIIIYVDNYHNFISVGFCNKIWIIYTYWSWILFEEAKDFEWKLLIRGSFWDWRKLFIFPVPYPSLQRRFRSLRVSSGVVYHICWNFSEDLILALLGRLLSLLKLCVTNTSAWI